MTAFRSTSATVIPLLVVLLTAPLAMAAVSAAETSQKELVYKSTPQGELKMHVHLPPGWQASDERPAIVFFFGGGWTGGTVEQFRDQAEYLATRGMVAARADYRVKSRHQVTPDECVKDAQSAVRYLRKNAAALGIDPERIVASGGSAGGHIAACTGAAAPLDTGDPDFAVSCRPNAMILFNPVLRFQGIAQLADRLGDKQDLAAVISPTLNLAKDTPPALILFGTGDQLFQHGEEYVARAKEVGNRAELFTAPKMPHGFFNRSPWKEKTLYRADEFLQTLGYVEGPPVLKLPDEKPE